MLYHSENKDALFSWKNIWSKVIFGVWFFSEARADGILPTLKSPVLSSSCTPCCRTSPSCASTSPPRGRSPWRTGTWPPSVLTALRPWRTNLWNKWGFNKERDAEKLYYLNFPWKATKYGIPVERRQYNWMQIPPPPEEAAAHLTTPKERLEKQIIVRLWL